MKRTLLALAFALFSTAAQAQCVNSTPPLVGGGTVFGSLVSQWLAYFGAKVDATSGQLCNPNIIGQILINGSPFSGLSTVSPPLQAVGGLISLLLGPEFQVLSNTLRLNPYPAATDIGTTAIITGNGMSTISSTTAIWNPGACSDATFNLPASPADNEPHTIVNLGSCPVNSLTISGNGKVIGKSASVVSTTVGSVSVRYSAVLGTWN